MSKNKTNTTKGNEPTVDNMAQLVLEEGKKIAKEDFAKLSAIVAVIFSAGLWVIKSMWYAYWSGRFFVYKIDTCYISADSENVFLQIMQLASILVIWGISNYIYYKIAVEEDKSKFCWKRKRNKLIFWAVEVIIVFAGALFFSSTHFGELIDEIASKDVLLSVIVLFITSFIICVLINIYAIEFVLEERLKKKKAKKVAVQENIDKKNEKRIKEIFILVIVTIAVEIVIVFIVAMWVERSRHSYKVIMIQSEETAESEFDIKYAGDNCKYKMYPVVYENQDCYVIVRLYNEDEKINIDYNYQRIIEKEGQEIIYLDNVYNVSGGN